MNSNATDRGRRRFLMGAAGVAAAPLVAAVAAGCMSDERSPESPATGANGAGDDANPVTAATTVAGRRTIGSLEVSSVGLGCQTMTGKLYGPVTSREDMVALIRTAVDQGVTFFALPKRTVPSSRKESSGKPSNPYAIRS